MKGNKNEDTKRHKIFVWDQWLTLINNADLCVFLHYFFLKVLITWVAVSLKSISSDFSKFLPNPAVATQTVIQSRGLVWNSSLYCFFRVVLKASRGQHDSSYSNIAILLLSKTPQWSYHHHVSTEFYTIQADDGKMPIKMMTLSSTVTNTAMPNVMGQQYVYRLIRSVTSGDTLGMSTPV